MFGDAGGRAQPAMLQGSQSWIFPSTCRGALEGQRRGDRPIAFSEHDQNRSGCALTPPPPPRYRDAGAQSSFFHCLSSCSGARVAKREADLIDIAQIWPIAGGIWPRSACKWSTWGPRLTKTGQHWPESARRAPDSTKFGLIPRPSFALRRHSLTNVGPNFARIGDRERPCWARSSPQFRAEFGQIL